MILLDPDPPGQFCGCGLIPDSMLSLDPYPDSRSGSWSAKMTHKNRKKVNKFHFLKYWMFSFDG